MSKKFSNLVEKIKPSFTLQMTARAAELRAQGEDVINFGVGEPDFNTPDHIIEAGKKAMIVGAISFDTAAGVDSSTFKDIGEIDDSELQTWIEARVGAKRVTQMKKELEENIKVLPDGFDPIGE